MSELLDAMNVCFSKIHSPKYFEHLAGKYAFPKNPDGTEIRDSSGKRTAGNVYPTPISNSLADFIRELDPYGAPYHKTLEERTTI